MMKFRLTYNGLAGFDYTGFDSHDELVAWAIHQAEMGLIVPLEMMVYDSKKDVYKVYGNFLKA